MMQELGLKGEAGGSQKDKTKKKLRAETRVCAKAQRQESTGKGGWQGGGAGISRDHAQRDSSAFLDSWQGNDEIRQSHCSWKLGGGGAGAVGGGSRVQVEEEICSGPGALKHSWGLSLAPRLDKRPQHSQRTGESGWKSKGLGDSQIRTQSPPNPSSSLLSQSPY